MLPVVIASLPFTEKAAIGKNAEQT